MDEIDYPGVVAQLQLENEALRRALGAFQCQAQRIYAAATRNRLLLAAAALISIFLILSLENLEKRGK